MLYLCIGLFTLSSCSPKLVYYTQELHQSLNFTESELKKVQFYLSQEVVLERAADLDQVEVQEGKIKLSKDRAVQQIKIPAKTPGTMVFSPDNKRLAISFDSGNDGEFLMFGPNPKVGHRYMLYASEWKRNSGIVTYGGMKYRTRPGAERTALMVEVDALERQRVESRTVRGRKP